jgi:hypothetical protein
MVVFVIELQKGAVIAALARWRLVIDLSFKPIKATREAKQSSVPLPLPWPDI